MNWRKWLGIPEPTEQRTISALPWADSVPFNMVPPLEDGMRVSSARALSLASVYAANRLLAQSISTLPLKAHRRVDDGRMPMTNLPQLFQQLKTDGQLVPWLHQCVLSLGLRGNAYGLIVSRDGFGFPTSIAWLNPSNMLVDDRRGKSGWLYDGREMSREQVVHIPLFPLPGERVSPSPIAAYANTLGIGLQAQAYASDWFAAGGFPPGTFQNREKTVDQDDAEAIKARVVNAIRTHQPLVYGNDWEYKPITIPPEEAQFVETMKMTTNAIASVYGIPPEMIGGESGSSMTYANVEQQQINFVMFTLRPWLVLLETAFSALLPDRQEVKFNSDALIRADLKTRWEVNQIRFQMGAASIDEIRAQEDEAPLPNGQGQQYGPAALPAQQPTPGETTPLRRIQ